MRLAQRNARISKCTNAVALPAGPTNHITPIIEASILIRIHGTAHSPGEHTDGLIAIAQDARASAELYEPRLGRITCQRRRRPGRARLEVGKHARWDKRGWERGIPHAIELHDRGQPPA